MKTINLSTHTLSLPVQFADGPGLLHGFTTGYVQVKAGFKTAKGGPLLSKVNFLLGRHFTDWMPIWVWVVQHPEGTFVIDTGENAQVSEPGYFRAEGRVVELINTRSFRFQVQPEQELGPQLTRLGYTQTDIRQVILTHLHLDHFDGLKHVQETEVALYRGEWEKPDFALPSLYPAGFAPRLLDLQDDPQQHFSGVHSLVASQEIQLVHTPGHTRGHCSVLVKTKAFDYLLAGDVSYDQAQLVSGTLAGGHQDFRLARQTFRRIQQYAQQHRLVYLPSHDPEALARMAQGAVLG